MILELPAEFVLAHATPDMRQTAAGFALGWLEAAEVVEIATARYHAGLTHTDAEEQLVLLLPADFDQVPSLLEAAATAEATAEAEAARAAEAATAEGPREDPVRLWLYLGLTALWQNRRQFPDPLGALRLLIADLGHPREGLDLMLFAEGEAQTDGHSEAVRQLTRSWQELMSSLAAEYAPLSRLKGNQAAK